MEKVVAGRCVCGNPLSRHAVQCKSCIQAHAAARHARITEARAIVAAGKCPQCGEPLRRKRDLAGWWQCAAFGAQDRPACFFQTFTV